MRLKIGEGKLNVPRRLLSPSPRSPMPTSRSLRLTSSCRRREWSGSGKREQREP